MSGQEGASSKGFPQFGHRWPLRPSGSLRGHLRPVGVAAPNRRGRRTPPQAGRVSGLLCFAWSSPSGYDQAKLCLAHQCEKTVEMKIQKGLF